MRTVLCTYMFVPGLRVQIRTYPDCILYVYWLYTVSINSCLVSEGQIRTYTCEVQSICKVQSIYSFIPRRENLTEDKWQPQKVALKDKQKKHCLKGISFCLNYFSQFRKLHRLGEVRTMHAYTQNLRNEILTKIIPWGHM